MKATIYKTVDGQKKPVMEYRLEGDTVIPSDSSAVFHQNMEVSGVLLRLNGTNEKVYPSDGKRFLEALKDFQGTYLWAQVRE